jgi:hypothetical protein
MLHLLRLFFGLLAWLRTLTMTQTPTQIRHEDRPGHEHGHEYF